MRDQYSNKALKTGNERAIVEVDSQQTIVLETDLLAFERHITGLLYKIWRLTGQEKEIIRRDR